MSKHLLCILSIIMATVVLIGCGGGGGGSKGGNDLNKLISTASKTVSGDTNTEIGDLSANGISLNLAKNSVEAGGKVTINQYSNIAAAARLSQQYPALASFTAISSLYDMSATDKNGKKVSTLNNPSELSIAVSEDISSEKLYFAAIKQNDNWDLTPLSTGANASYRAAVSQSKTVKVTVNTVFDSLFIAAAPKANIPSKLTYAEAFDFSVNGSTTTPQTIAASYIQKFDNDIEVNIRLTLKGGLTPDKADMTLTAIQNGNKTIGIRKTDKSYKDMTFTSTDETGKYKGSIKLDSSLATISMAGDTATYTFYIKAKDIAVSDMPSTLILRASITGSKPFYSSDMQINFAKGPDRVANNVKMTTPSTTSDVAANTTVVLNFDQPVKIDSGREAVLIPVTIGGNTVKADYNFSNSNKTLTIKFSENLAFNTKYTVSIKSGIQSENIKYKDVTPIDFVFTTGARRYTITFDGNGKTAGEVPTERDSFLSKATYTLPTTTDLVKTGYLFSCWNTKADGTGTDYTLGSNVTFTTSDITLYAKWAKTYSITFDGNGNTAGEVPTERDSFLTEATYTLPATTDLVKTGYKFSCWNTKADGTGTDYALGSTITFDTSDIILYAKWDKTYSIIFDGNGHTEGIMPQYDNIDEAEPLIMPTDIGKNHYLLESWNTKPDGTGIIVTDYMTPGFIANELGIKIDTITLYAIWKKIPVCNIVYDGNGSTSGSVPIDNNFYEMKNTITYCDGGVYITYYPAYTSLNEESVNKVIAVASVGNMTKEGYVFSHWNTKADDTGDKINPGDLLTVSGYEYVIFGGSPTIIDDNNPIIIGDSGVDKDKTVILYAQWEEKPTYVGGIINANTTWTLANSPYELTSDVQIAEDVVLTIEPGVVVNGKGYYIGAYSGILKAIGNKDQRIIFNNTDLQVHNPEGKSWLDLEFIHTKNSKICPGTGNSAWNYITLKDSIVEDMPSPIELCYPKGNCYIERNIFKDSCGITFCTMEGSIYINNNVFINWREYLGKFYAIECSSGSLAYVEKNSFLSTDRYAITLKNGYGGAVISAINNYWNTTDENTIKNMIYDKNDNLECCDVIEYYPFLTKPDSNTPSAQ